MNTQNDLVSVTTIVLGFSLLVSVGLVVIQMCELTNSPKFHNRSYQFASVGGYLLLSSFLVSSIFIIINILGTSTLPPITWSDWQWNFLFSCVFALMLSSLQYFRVISQVYTNSDKTQDLIQEFLNAIENARDPQPNQHRERLYQDVLDKGRELEIEMADPTLADEKQLYSDLTEWLDSFEAHQVVSREKVLTSSDYCIQNKELRQEQHDIQSITHRLELIK